MVLLKNSLPKVNSGETGLRVGRDVTEAFGENIEKAGEIYVKTIEKSGEMVFEAAEKINEYGIQIVKKVRFW